MKKSKFHETALTTYYVTDEGKLLSTQDGQEFRELATYNVRGYQRVRINRTIFKVHRLVAEAFIPNPHNLPIVIHIDGNHTNNRVENLKWSDKKTGGFQKKIERI